MPFETWRGGVSDEDAATTLEHIARSPNCSVAKAERLLGYRPRYSSLEAVRESLASLLERGELA